MACTVFIDGVETNVDSSSIALYYIDLLLFLFLKVAFHLH